MGKAPSATSYASQSSLNAIMAQNRADPAGAAGQSTGTSIFDPVLCELAYRWWCPPGGLVLDPFAGGSVRGVVAAKLGRPYVGVELRAEQVDANRVQWDEIGGTQTGGIDVPISAAWAMKKHNCTLAHIMAPGGCGGKCCTGQTRWPSKAFGEQDFVCGNLGPEGCTLSPDDKPIGCHLYPFIFNKNGKLVYHDKAAMKASVCAGAAGNGPPMIDAQRSGLIALFGEEQFNRVRADVMAGRDSVFHMDPQTAAEWRREQEWEAAGAKPAPRRSTPVDLPGQAAPVWHAGDSRDIGAICEGVEADFIFSCPPYADLEVYSDDPADLSTLGYPEFRDAYFEIIKETCDLLKPNRFACFVVGEARGPDGMYYGLVPDTIEAFRRAGLGFYNDAVLLTMVGSLPIRAGRQFAGSRKLGKTHQNVLVFCKGDPRKAVEALGDVEFGEIEDGDAGQPAVGDAPAPDAPAPEAAGLSDPWGDDADA